MIAFLLQEASGEDNLFAFVPEFYVNILPILLDTVMDFSFHDLNVQNDLSGKLCALTQHRLVLMRCDPFKLNSNCSKNTVNSNSSKLFSFNRLFGVDNGSG